MSPRIHFVSLGCPKNRVDTERMVALARRQGLTPDGDAAASELIVVNTCGFIEAAKRESIETILRLAEHKHSGECRTLVVAGCLSQRYPEQLARDLPEVDAFIGTADLGRLQQLLGGDRAAEAERVVVGKPEGMDEADYGRELIGPPHSAYLKISEGCNRPCAFCSIPLMRGRQRSRTMASLVEEAGELARRGVRELILIAQDTTAYGRDLARGEADLVTLLERLDAVEGLRWIRLHYAYPSMVDDRLAEAMARLGRVVPYIDMPIQHIDDAVLRGMRRGYGGEQVRRAIARLRVAMPEVWIRTTMLVGHPGETEAAQKRLLDFVAEAEIDHLGAFVFSSEEGTVAATQPDAVPTELAVQRRDAVMACQQRSSRQRLQRLEGRVIEVMIDGPSDESELLLQGRHAGQSPEIDGVVVLADAAGAPGDIIRARVEATADYDLVARAEVPCS